MYLSSQWSDFKARFWIASFFFRSISSAEYRCWLLLSLVTRAATSSSDVPSPLESNVPNVMLSLLRHLVLSRFLRGVSLPDAFPRRTARDEADLGCWCDEDATTGRLEFIDVVRLDCEISWFAGPTNFESFVEGCAQTAFEAEETYVFKLELAACLVSKFVDPAKLFAFVNGTTDFAAEVVTLVGMHFTSVRELVL